MIYVDRQRRMTTATPEEIFSLFEDPADFLSLIPRVRKTHITHTTGHDLSLQMWLALGGVFGTAHVKGALHWAAPHEVVFHAHTSLEGTIHWTLSPAHYHEGTDLRITAQLDIAPMLGPMAFFVPETSVERKIGNALGEAFDSLSALVEHHTPPLCPVLLPSLTAASSA
jgi:carbon monoxide dehydrogenase subunit G